MSAGRKALYLLMWCVPGEDGLYYEWGLLDTDSWVDVIREMNQLRESGEIVDFIAHHFEPATHPPVNGRSALKTVHDSLKHQIKRPRLKKAPSRSKAVDDKDLADWNKMVRRADDVEVPEAISPGPEYDEPDKPVSPIPDDPDYFGE